MYLCMINKYILIFKWYGQILFVIKKILNILRCLDIGSVNHCLQIRKPVLPFKCQVCIRYKVCKAFLDLLSGKKPKTR